MQNYSFKRYSLYKYSLIAVRFTFPKWGKGDRRRAVDEDVKK